MSLFRRIAGDQRHVHAFVADVPARGLLLVTPEIPTGSLLDARSGSLLDAHYHSGVTVLLRRYRNPNLRLHETK